MAGGTVSWPKGAENMTARPRIVTWGAAYVKANITAIPQITPVGIALAAGLWALRLGTLPAERSSKKQDRRV